MEFRGDKCAKVTFENELSKHTNLFYHKDKKTGHKCFIKSKDSVKEIAYTIEGERKVTKLNSQNRISTINTAVQ